MLFRSPVLTGSFDSGDPLTTNIHVGNLPASVTEASLGMLFAQYGPVGSVKVRSPRSSFETCVTHELRRSCGLAPMDLRSQVVNSLGSSPSCAGLMHRKRQRRSMGRNGEGVSFARGGGRPSHCLCDLSTVRRRFPSLARGTDDRPQRSKERRGASTIAGPSGASALRRLKNVRSGGDAPPMPLRLLTSAGGTGLC